MEMTMQDQWFLLLPPHGSTVELAMA